MRVLDGLPRTGPPQHDRPTAAYHLPTHLLIPQVDAPLGHGQSIFVTGNGPALGDDDPLNGVPLYTTPAEYPRWSSDWGKGRDGMVFCCVCIGVGYRCGSAWGGGGEQH